MAAFRTTSIDAQALELEREVTGTAIKAGETPRPADLPNDLEHDFAVYDRTGRRLFGEGPASADEFVRRALAGDPANGQAHGERVSAVPIRAGKVLRGAEPVSEANDRTRTRAQLMAGAAVVLVAVIVIAVSIRLRRLIRHFDELRRSAQRLGDGDFTIDPAVTGLAELDELGAVLAGSARRIGLLVEREREFSSNASHQMRTPLAGLRVAVEAELASPRDDPTVVLHEVLGAVDRLDETVAGLLSLAHEPTVDCEPMLLRPMVTEAVARRRHLGERPVTITIEPALMLTARKAAVSTVLDVLLDNAIIHGQGAITISGARVGDGLRIDVTDQGHLRTGDDDLFDRHRSPAGRTGIGLHLARTLAEAEGGRLRLTGTDPTTFTLTLPPSDRGSDQTSS